MAYGDDATKKRYVWPAVQGDEIWCQLFSEPAGGSDVAALRTQGGKERRRPGRSTARRSGPRARSSPTTASCSPAPIPNVPKHKGLTMFYLSMKTPGVEVRPIKQACGGSGFNEVFFTDVKVKDSQRLGEVGQGWQVALTTLMHERLAVGGGQGGGLDVPQLMQLARTLELEDGPAIKNAAVREKIADWYVRSAGLKYTTYAHDDGAVAGPAAGPGSLDRQDRRRFQAAGPLAPSRWSSKARAGALKGDDAPMHGAFQIGLARRAGPSHRGRHGRNPAQHHRRARAGPSRRHPRRQGRPVQQDADGHARWRWKPSITTRSTART